MRLLIIGINYSPEPTGIGPYTAGLAQYLAGRGHVVTVVTGLPSYPQWRVYKGYRHVLAARSSEDGVEVLRRWHHVPRVQAPARRALYEATFLLTGLSALIVPRPELVLGIVPSLSGGILARLAGHRFASPYALVFQDLVGLAAVESGLDTGDILARAVEAAEIWAARRAAAVGVIAEGFRRHLVAHGIARDRIWRVRNWTLVGKGNLSRDQVRDRLGLPREALICLHAGNMGYKQGLENVVECARLASGTDRHLLFVLVGDGSQRAAIVKKASKYHLPNLRILPVLEEGLFTSALSGADLLLVNQRPSVQSMALPGKLTSYFAAGKPIIAAVASESETAAEIRVSRAGVLVAPGDPSALLQAISQLANSPSRQATLSLAARQYAEKELTPEPALARFEQFLEEARTGARA